jgi:DeoR family transcriptional regulator of aga operon
VDRAGRWNLLLERLNVGGRISVEEASELLAVSTATIRRDLDELARQQLLTRTHGGAIVNGVSFELPMRYKAARRAPEKLRIAEKAAGLVPPGSVVALNGGTTTTEIALALVSRADLQDDSKGRPLTVVTNALNIAHDLAVRPNVKMVLTGGVVRPQSYELVGPLAMQPLLDLNFDFAMIGVDAVDAVTGASARHEDEASINRLMATRADVVVVVADSSKLGRHAFARTMSLAEIDILITDSAAPRAVLQDLESVGCEILLA